MFARKYIRNKEHKLFCESWFLKVKMFWTAEENSVAGWQTCVSFSFFSSYFEYLMLTSLRVTEMFGLERTLKPSLLQADSRSSVSSQGRCSRPLIIFVALLRTCSNTSVLSAPELDTVLQEGSQRPEIKGQNHLPLVLFKDDKRSTLPSHHTSTKIGVYCHRLVVLNTQLICMAKYQRTE